MPTVTKKTTKKPAVKKTTKKTVKKTTKKTVKKPAKGTTNTNVADPVAQKLRRQAKSVAISIVQYKVLLAIAKHGGGLKGDGLSYKGIKKHTGYYSILTAVCRVDHDGSLVDLGLVKEKNVDMDEKDVLHFALMAKGKTLITKAAKTV